MTFLLFLIGSLLDGGPIYAETNETFLIVEPFNAISSLAYLFPAIYWLAKLKGRYKEYSFLVACLPLLILGGLGSTLYHAFRNSSWLLFMDVFPIAILTLMVSIYFWIKVLPKWWHLFFVLIPFALTRYMVFTTLQSGSFRGTPVEIQTAINVSYFITGLMIFVPAILLMMKQKFHKAHYIAISCLLFMLGLFFRETDTWDISWMSIGTHWLWHISTAAGAWVLGRYLYAFRNQEIWKD